MCWQRLYVTAVADPDEFIGFMEPPFDINVDYLWVNIFNFQGLFALE